MTELIKTLDSTINKYKNKYALICEPLKGLESRKNNASKFDEINAKFIKEVIEDMNNYLEKNTNIKKEDVIEVGKSYIKKFSKQLINPFL